MRVRVKYTRLHVPELCKTVHHANKVFREDKGAMTFDDYKQAMRTIANWHRMQGTKESNDACWVYRIDEVTEVQDD